MLMENETINPRRLLSFEKIDTLIYTSVEEVCTAVANEIAALITSKNAEGEKTVLGLATGATPRKVYTALIRLHKDQGLNFENVVVFNLDEYYGLQPDAIQSYSRFMYENLFNHINIKRITCRNVFTMVPCTKLMLRIRFTFLSSRPKILYVFLFRRFTSCLVSPRLFTSSMFLRDSVVEPANAVVSPTIFFWMIFIFLLKKFVTRVRKKIPPT